MITKFDELTKSMAQSMTRKQALKKFSVSIAGIALACFGLAKQAHAGTGKGCKPSGSPCNNHNQCCSGFCFTGGSGFGFTPYCY